MVIKATNIAAGDGYDKYPRNELEVVYPLLNDLKTHKCVTSFIFSRLEPYVQPTREITKIIKRKFVGCWANYGEIKKKDEVVVELWYKEFQRKYKWLPEMSTTLRRHLIIRLLISWNKDNWKGKSQVNTRNRRSSDGPLHTGG
ncbi:hypothetical protein QL285_093516 [Trifolium repens]|nr:hypothetical protein QL285_093516 [Trifolium repens]